MPFDLGPKPHLGYTDSILARVAERRGDDAFLETCAADKNCGMFAIGGELVVMRKTANGVDPLFSADEIRALAPVTETVFLGLVGEAGRFGIALDVEATKALKGRPDLLVTDLRSIAVQVAGDAVVFFIIRRPAGTPDASCRSPTGTGLPNPKRRTAPAASGRRRRA